MASKQQISFSLAFLAVAIIILQLSAQATAQRRVLLSTTQPVTDAATVRKAEEELIKELIGATELAKAKVPTLGNSQMVQACDQAYASALGSLNKALGLVTGNAAETAVRDQLEASTASALQAYEKCDTVYALSYRPSPFIVNQINLKRLVKEFMDLIPKESNTKH